MAGKIRGITIELSGDTKGLVKSMQSASKATKEVQRQLKDVDKVLKFNPKSTELLTQKQKLLKDAVTKTAEQLEKEKTALENLKNASDSDKTVAQQEALARQIAETEQKLKDAEKAYKNFGSVGAQQTKAIGEKMKGIGDAVSNVGSELTKKVSLPIVGLFTGSAKAAIDWESAFTGVMKTVDETVTTTYADIEEGLKGIATRTASSKEEIAGVAEVAGQLGVSADDVVRFTETMVQLGDTTNLSAEEAATSLARILNITGENTESVDKLGSVIVALGNNMATSESEIVSMSNRLAASGTLAGLTTQEIFALASSMSSVGIQAEAGGTAMTQTLTTIEQEVANFSEGFDNNLEQIANISGMTAEEFASAWENKPIDAIQAFIKGLGNLDEQGESATLVLDELGMSGIRQSNMLKSLALASDTLTDAIEISNTAYEENSALQNEASLRYQTTAAKMSQMKERISEVGIELGEKLLPYVEKAIDFVGSLMEKWDGLSPAMQTAIPIIGLLVAAIGPLLMGIGNIIVMVGQIMTFAPTIMAAITALSGPIGIVVAAIAAVIAILVTLWLKWDDISAWISDKIQWLKDKWELFKQKISEVVSNVKSKIDEMRAKIGEKIEQIQQKIETLKQKWESLKQKVADIKENIVGKIEDLKGRVESAFKSIQKFMEDPIGSAKKFIDEKVQAIKNLFPLSIGKIFSNFKMPHIEWSWKDVAGIVKIPSFSVSWYKQAATQGAIFDKPTIFGMQNGRLLGAGDARQPEALVGVNTMQSLIAGAVNQGMNSDGMYNAVVRGMSNVTMQVFLDGKDITANVNKRNNSVVTGSIRIKGAF